MPQCTPTGFSFQIWRDPTRVHIWSQSCLHHSDCSIVCFSLSPLVSPPPSLSPSPPRRQLPLPSAPPLRSPVRPPSSAMHSSGGFYLGLLATLVLRPHHRPVRDPRCGRFLYRIRFRSIWALLPYKAGSAGLTRPSKLPLPHIQGRSCANQTRARQSMRLVARSDIQQRRPKPTQLPIPHHTLTVPSTALHRPPPPRSFRPVYGRDPREKTP